MPEFNNPIEKYNEQDKAIANAVGKTVNILDYALNIFYGVIIGSFLWALLYSWSFIYAGSLLGGISGVLFTRLGIFCRKKFGDDMPLVPIMLGACLVVVCVMWIGFRFFGV